MELETGIWDGFGVFVADWVWRGGAILLVGLLVAWAIGRVRSAWGFVTLLGFVLAALAVPLVQWGFPSIAVLPGAAEVWEALPGSRGAAGEPMEIHRGGEVVGEAVVVKTTTGAFGVWFFAWAAGALGLLVRLLWGAAGLWWTARKARAAAGVVEGPVEAVAKRLGVRRRVKVLVSETAPVAMTWGWFSPRLLLPVEAQEWPAAKLEAVVLHELGHVKRWDVVWGATAQLACVVLWPTLVVFWAARRLESLAERACDDFVVAAGGDARVYAGAVLEATALVEVEREPRASWPVAAMACRGGKVEERVLGILDAARNRRPAGVAGCVCAVVLGVVGVGLGGLLEVRAEDGGSAVAPAKVTGTVVLDAGHGGRDDGGKAGDLVEKDLALELTKRVKQELEAKGVRVVMTRTTDVFVPLVKRGKLAAMHRPAPFVSVHFNTARDAALSGFETYYSPEGHPASARLARAVQGGLEGRSVGRNRGVKEAPFSVVRSRFYPAVLVEGGFMSNAAELEKIVSEAHQEELAKGIAEGLVGYLQGE